MSYLVTGGESGLGAEVIRQLREMGETAINLPGSVMLSGKDAIHSAIRSMPNIRYVINNFGINHLSWIGETPEEDEDIVQVNLLGPYWVVNALMEKGDVCRALNVASATYRIPQRTTSLYCASKAGLVHMTRVMARELAHHGWVVNAIAPGPIEGTTMTRMVNEQVEELRGWTRLEAEAYERKLIPMGRRTTVTEVAAAIIAILDLPEYVNGACIDMTGGA
jgi:NAD(P)-dependent dehydrogenase (short-subunit alcohol dehydrogenase family)